MDLALFGTVCVPPAGLLFGAMMPYEVVALTMKSVERAADLLVKECMQLFPKNYWLCAATDISIKVWDLENKSVLDELHSTAPPKRGIPWYVSAMKHRWQRALRKRH